MALNSGVINSAIVVENRTMLEGGLQKGNHCLTKYTEKSQICKSSMDYLINCSTISFSFY